MADDLVKITVELCGKKQDRGSRFPKYLYDTYVNRLLTFALDIQKCIFTANEMRLGEARAELQKQAACTCVPFAHLVRIAADNGWISAKQCERWQKLIKSVKYKIIAWNSSDMKRS